MKCDKCNKNVEHYYNNMNLCRYHYWIERGRPKNTFSFHHWQQYRGIHPVRVNRWCEMDADLNDFLNGGK